MPMRRQSVRIFAVIAAFIALASAAPGEPADRDQLLFHAETLEGAVLATQNDETPFNPASLVKVGTSLWALERLGPDFRYRTVFGVAGDWDKATGRLVGSLVVQGWGDPDFQAENVFLVARMLNRLRLTRIEGWLAIDGQISGSAGKTGLKRGCSILATGWTSWGGGCGWCSTRSVGTGRPGPPGRPSARAAGGTLPTRPGWKSSVRPAVERPMAGYRWRFTGPTRCRRSCADSTCTRTTILSGSRTVLVAPQDLETFLGQRLGLSAPKCSSNRHPGSDAIG